MPLKCPLKNGENGAFYVACIFTISDHFFKKPQMNKQNTLPSMWRIFIPCLSLILAESSHLPGSPQSAVCPGFSVLVSSLSVHCSPSHLRNIRVGQSAVWSWAASQDRTLPGAFPHPGPPTRHPCAPGVAIVKGFPLLFPYHSATDRGLWWPDKQPSWHPGLRTPLISPRHSTIPTTVGMPLPGPHTKSLLTTALPTRPPQPGCSWSLAYLPHLVLWGCCSNHCPQTTSGDSCLSSPLITWSGCPLRRPWALPGVPATRAHAPEPDSTSSALGCLPSVGPSDPSDNSPLPLFCEGPCPNSLVLAPPLCPPSEATPLWGLVPPQSLLLPHPGTPLPTDRINLILWGQPKPVPPGHSPDCRSHEAQQNPQRTGQKGNGDRGSRGPRTPPQQQRTTLFPDTQDLIKTWSRTRARSRFPTASENWFPRQHSVLWQWN